MLRYLIDQFHQFQLEHRVVGGFRGGFIAWAWHFLINGLRYPTD